MRPLVLLAAAVVLGACTPGSSAPSPSAAPPSAPTASPAPASAPAADSTEWTLAAVEHPASGDAQAQLEAVRAARHETYDRVVFEFGAVRPATRVAYLDGPAIACGSGEPVELPGEGGLEVRFSGARAHDERGHATAAPPRRDLGLPSARALVQTCDFEGEVTWIVAAGSAEPFRVLALDGPPRVVVDVRHPQP